MKSKGTGMSGEERANAFTPTKLVLVPGVIALMAGVLLPAYASSGRKTGQHGFGLRHLKNTRITK